MQCVTPDKLTGFFWYVFVYVESIFVVELMLRARRFRDILDTGLLGGKTSQDRNQWGCYVYGCHVMGYKRIRQTGSCIGGRLTHCARYIRVEIGYVCLMA